MRAHFDVLFDLVEVIQYSSAVPVGVCYRTDFDHLNQSGNMK